MTADINATPFRLRWYQFRLRSLLVFMTVAGMLSGWAGTKIRDARNQANTVAAFKASGAIVNYRYFWTDDDPPGPEWLRNVLGIDYFDAPVAAQIYRDNDVARACPLLREMPELTYLDLHGSKITDQDVTVLENYLPKLERINITDTSITDEGLIGLSNKPFLKSLGLTQTKMSGAGFKYLRTSTKLESVYLGQMPLSDGACQELEHFNLSILHIGDAPMGDVGAVAIGKIKTLKSLQLDKTNIGDVGIEHLENLTQLEFLSLRNTSVSDKSAKALARLSNLKTLDLSGTKVTDEMMAALKALPLLEELNVARTDVTDIGFAFLDEYPNIKRINVGSTLVHTEVSCNWWLKHRYARVGGKNSRVTSDPKNIDALPVISIMDTLTISSKASTFDNENETGWGK